MGAVGETDAENPVAPFGVASDPIWQRSVVGNIEPDPTASVSVLKLAAVDYHSLGPIYRYDKVSKNKQQLDMTRIPNTILQMVYMKLYIPLLMLTTSALSKICSNDGLKYHKIPFGNGVGWQSLDKSHENTLTCAMMAATPQVTA